MPSVRCHAVDATLRPIVAALDSKDGSVQGIRFIELAGMARGIGCGDHALHHGLASRLEVEAIGRVVRVALGGLLEHGDAFLVVALIDRREPIAMQVLGRAAGQEADGQGHHDGRSHR